MKRLKLYLKLFFTMIKIGTFTFGGGYAMISLIRKEFVEVNNWISDDEFMDMITISESTPGPIAINMATFVGNKVGGFVGSVILTIGIVLPSFIIMLLLSLVLTDLLEQDVVKHAFVGINCGVSVLLGNVFFGMIKQLKKGIFYYCLFAFSLIATFIIMLFGLNISTVYLILFGGILSCLEFLVVLKKGRVK